MMIARSAIAILCGVAACAVSPREARAQRADPTSRSAIGARITGRVRDAVSGAPVAGATIEVEGLALLATSDSAGDYRLLRVPPGPQVLRVRRLGYAPGRLAVTVPTGGTLVRDLELAQSALRMQEVTVTADPASRARGELGTASVVDRTAIATQAAASLAGVLELVPGTPISPPGLDGVQQAIIRSVPTSAGNASLGGVAGPSPADLAALGTLIVVDGIPRSNNANLQSTGLRGEQTIPSSAGGGVDLRTIPAATLERVEVVRGVPSARYGDLTQGAILVETRAGAFRPEALARYDAQTVEVSTAGGQPLGLAQLLSGTFDATRTLVAPGIRDDRVFRFSGQLAHRLAIGGVIDPGVGAATGTASRAVLDSRLEVTQLYANNPEQPDVVPGYANWSRDLSLRLQERLTVGSAAARHLDVSGALGFTRQRSYSQQLHLRGAQPFTDRLTEGRAVGRYVQGSYLAQLHVDGEPWLAYLRAEEVVPGRMLGLDHRVVAGSELRREWNTGPGYQFDIAAPPQSSFNGVQGFDRPRRYDAVPPVATSGWYVDDRAILPLPWGMSGELQAGGRLDVLHRGKAWLSKSRDAVLQPRLNAQLAPRPWVRLRGGVGRTAKLPTLGTLYPAPEYYDVVNVNWYVPEPDERLAVLTTFVRDPTNPDLGFSVGRKAEAGLEVDVGRTGATVSLVRFADGVDGGVGYYPHPGFVERAHYQLTDSAGGTGQPPEIIEPPSSVDTVPIVVDVPTNSLTLRNRGWELVALLPEIPVIRTRVQVQGAWVKSRMRSDAPDFGAANRFADFQLGSGLQRIPYWESVQQTGTRALLTWRAVHHQPRLGLVVTATVQHTLREERRDVGEMDTLAFTGYLTRAGALVPVPPDERAGAQYHDLHVTRSGLSTIPRGAPSDWLASLQVSKAVGAEGRLTFFAFNVFDREGRYAANGVSARLYPPVRFGMELSVPFGGER